MNHKFTIGDYVRFNSSYSNIKGKLKTGKVTSKIGTQYLGVTSLTGGTELYFKVDEVKKIEKPVTELQGTLDDF